MQTRRMRALRHKHGITMIQLAKCAGICQQLLSDIELGKEGASKHRSEMMDSAFLRLIGLRRKALSEMEADYQRYKGRLLEHIDEPEECP